MSAGPVLKPCPFCGCDPHVVQINGSYQLLHDDSLAASMCVLARLGVVFSYSETLDAIGYSWNKRVSDDVEGGK